MKLTVILLAGMLVLPLCPQNISEKISNILSRLPFIGNHSGVDMEKDFRVKIGERFDIELEQPLHPNHGWKCTSHNLERLELMEEGLKPSEDPGLMGVTVKYFTFETLKQGNTEIMCGYGTLNPDGSLKVMEEERVFSIEIV